MNDADRKDWQALIADAVYRGTMKAIGMYLLISAAVGVLLWLIRVLGSQ